MASHWLIFQLVFILLLAQASSSILDDTTSIEDTPEIEDETPDKNSGLDDIDDGDLPEEEFDELTSLDEIDDEGLPGELMPESDPQSRTRVKSLILRLAKHFEEKCRRNTSHLQARRTKKPASRLYYQAYQHGKKSSVNDKEWKETLKSEQCSACVLNWLCRLSWMQILLGIRGTNW